MAYPHKFLSLDNFQLAFRRLIHASNHEYKIFYAHLLGSYLLALRENLLDLIGDIRKGTYEPEIPVLVYQPKESGVLRPIAVLSLRDLIVYQAVMNYVALRMEKVQEKYALTRSFGAIFAGRDSDYFYRDWKKDYQAYCAAFSRAFGGGNDYVAEFDLVSFYELIDHDLLQRILQDRVNSKEVLVLLRKCLEAWRRGRTGESVGHGIPQGPEPSAFLAECVLFRLDALRLKQTVYLRYIDDIRLMAKGPIPLRRALVKLDLSSKDLGLVPQAQKIGMRQITDPAEALKTVPSGLLLAVSRGVMRAAAQQRLLKIFKASLVRGGRGWRVRDTTTFRYALLRMKPRRDILRRIRPLLVSRPDLSWVLSQYARKFEGSKEAADVLLHALQENPVYDAAAMNYIEALDLCEPSTGRTEYRRAIETALRRSEERSALIRLACLTFRGRRSGPKDAMRLISREPEPLVKGMAICRLFGEEGSLYRPDQCRDLLEAEIAGDDADLARYCAALRRADPVGGSSWARISQANDSVKILTKALGLRRKGPKKPGIIETFCKRNLRIAIPFPWKKALGGALRDAEQRCLRLQLEVHNPDSQVPILDTYNEALLQRFSQKHPELSSAYKACAGKRPQPDFGRWLDHAALRLVLPRSISWFRWVHEVRVGGQLAHARHHGGPKRGKPTRPIPWKKAERIMKSAPSAYVELMLEWKKIL